MTAAACARSTGRSPSRSAERRPASHLNRQEALPSDLPPPQRAMVAKPVSPRTGPRFRVHVATARSRTSVVSAATPPSLGVPWRPPSLGVPWRVVPSLVVRIALPRGQEQHGGRRSGRVAAKLFQRFPPELVFQVLLFSILSGFRDSWRCSLLGCIGLSHVSAPVALIANLSSGYIIAVRKNSEILLCKTWRAIAAANPGRELYNALLRSGLT